MRSKNEIQAAIQKIERFISQLSQEVSTLTARIGATQGKLNSLPNDSALRSERQEALVRGEDVTPLTAQITKTRELRELYSDELTGLNHVMMEKNQAIEGAQSELKALTAEMALYNGSLLVTEYNRAAKELAEIVKRMYNYQKEYSAAGGVGCFYEVALPFTDSAATRIPKIFLHGEEKPMEHTELMFWDKHSAHLL